MCIFKNSKFFRITNKKAAWILERYFQLISRHTVSDYFIIQENYAKLELCLKSIVKKKLIQCFCKMTIILGLLYKQGKIIFFGQCVCFVKNIMLTTLNMNSVFSEMKSRPYKHAFIYLCVKAQ